MVIPKAAARAFGRLVRVNEDRPSSGTGACSDEIVSGLLTDYAYDPANRLITVAEVDGASTRPIKSFHYARGNDGTDLGAGKPVLSRGPPEKTRTGL
ncbi:MAG: hypothetical protein GY722_06410 [bacterium]|nr:hypothetical protein [bacterium]